MCPCHLGDLHQSFLNIPDYTLSQYGRRGLSSGAGDRKIIDPRAVSYRNDGQAQSKLQFFTPERLNNYM
jgi:hypothetical protein